MIENSVKGPKGTKNITMVFCALIFINFTFFRGDDFWPKCKPIDLERRQFSTKVAFFVDNVKLCLNVKNPKTVLSFFRALIFIDFQCK